jgi:hypothetical protein
VRVECILVLLEERRESSELLDVVALLRLRMEEIDEECGRLGDCSIVLDDAVEVDILVVLTIKSAIVGVLYGTSRQIS